MASAHVERNSTPQASWELATRAVAPGVRSCAPVYVGYTEHSPLAIRRFEVPHPNVTVIINLGDPLAVHAPQLQPSGETYRSFAAGLFDTVALTESCGLSQGIELNVTPLGMWQLVGVPMHELKNRAVDLHTLLGPSANRLEGQLRDAGTWDARFDLLDAVLTKRLQVRQPPAAVRWAWTALCGDRKGTSVSDIARELQWSRRRLAETFREYVGVTPKTLSRIVRFDRAVRAVRSSAQVRWSSLAFACGYSDQAHLVREFKEFSGLSPTEFMKRQGPGGLSVVC